MAARASNLVIVKSNCQVLFSLPIDDIYLGRSDASRDIFPHLDLMSDGALEAGVSRHHATIYQSDDQLFVKDMDSANGTFLNSQRIDPHQPYLLNKGDKLQLGTLQLLVEFGTLKKE